MIASTLNELLLPVPLGLVVGLVLALTGAGGSILAVPLLMAVLGIGLSQAAATALPAVALASAIGTWLAWRKGLVRYRAATLMGLTALLVAPFGVRVAALLDPRLLALVFAAVLLIVATRLLLQARRAPAEAAVAAGNLQGDAGRAVCRLDPSTGRIRWNSPCAGVLGSTGLGVGFLSGLLGIGGGFMVVPVLRRATELSMQGAVATSLMVMTLSTGSAAVSATLHRGMSPAALPFAAGAVTGMLGGRRLAGRISGAGLQQAFGSLLIGIAILMAVHGLGVF
jgi:uncharacterized membrane protein YfcA